MIEIPPGLSWWRTQPGGAAWLDALPGIVEACVDEWGLTLGPTFESGRADGQLVGYVTRATLPDGTQAVLKVNFPDDESRYEPDALAFWDGRGAISLLASQPDARALLLERCEPGTQLWEVEDDSEATRYAATAMQRIWRPAPVEHPFETLAQASQRWTGSLRRDYEALGRPFEARLLDQAIDACKELGPTQGESVVLHQDLHGGNILRATREPWLIIDPKPLVGEREFDAASLLRDRRADLVTPAGGPLIRQRLDILVSELGLDRKRTRGWAVVHALVWGMGPDKLEPDMLHAARLISGTQ